MESVQRIQEFLEVSDNKLVNLAVEARTNRPAEVKKIIKERSLLSELFLCVKDMSDEDLKNVIDTATKK